MFTILKPFHWIEKTTGEMLHFINKDVSSCGKNIESLGADALKELELKKYIGKCSEKLPIESLEDNDQKIKKRAKKEK